MSACTWLLAAVALVVLSSGVNSVSNVTAIPATQTTFKTTEAWVKHLENLITMMGKSNTATDSQSHIAGNLTGSDMIKMLPNLLKMFGTSGDKGKGTGSGMGNLLQNWMKMLRLAVEKRNGTGNGMENLLQNWMKKLGLPVDKRNVTGNGMENLLQNWMKMLGLPVDKRNGTGNGMANLLQNWMNNVEKQIKQTNGTANRMGNLLQNWMNMFGDNAKDMLSTPGVIRGIEDYLLNQDIPSFLNRMLPGLNIGQGTSNLNDALMVLFQKDNIQKWLAPMLSQNPDLSHGISGLFRHQNNQSTMTQLMSFIGPIVKIYAEQMVASVGTGLEGMNISAGCSNHTARILSGMLDGQMWALQYIDALGKPQSGLVEGALFWSGSFHECLNIVSPGTEDSFKGNYCLLRIPIPPVLMTGLSQAVNTGANTVNANGLEAALFASMLTIQYGVCVPSSCSAEDLGIMVNQGLLERLPKSWYGEKTPSVQPVCHTEQHFKQDNRAVIVVCVLAGLGFILLLGTTYDVTTLLLWQHRRRRKSVDSKLNDIKLSDVVSNGNGHIQMPNGKDREISVIQISTTGKETIPDTEVLANGVSDKPEMTSNGISHMNNVKKEPKSEGNESRPKPGIIGSILMAFSLYTNTKKLVSTDTKAGSLGAIHGVRFFSMTWVLLGHTFIFHIPITNDALAYSEDFNPRWTAQGITNALVSVDSFFTLSGLLVSYLTLKEMAKAKSAKINWLMFYFHRFWRLTPPYMLILVTWVSLFQYWGIGPQWLPGQAEPVNCNKYWWKNLLYINNFELAKGCMGHTWYLANDMQFYIISPLILVPLFYSKILGLTILALFFLATFITTGVISYINGFKPFDARPDFMDKMYVKPWCRIGPYLAGMLVGYILFKTKCKAKLRWSTVVLGWCFAIVTCLATLYGLYGESHGNPLSNEASAVYNALHRTAWGAGLGWLLFACITGYGGIINIFLSWKAFIPLARLTYMTYLIHLMIITYFNNTAQGPFYMTDITISYMFVGNLVFTYLVAFLISLSFEAPFVGLERVIFRRNR